VHRNSLASLAGEVDTMTVTGKMQKFLRRAQMIAELGLQ
jgi:hypothetical protein